MNVRCQHCFTVFERPPWLQPGEAARLCPKCGPLPERTLADIEYELIRNGDVGALERFSTECGRRAERQERTRWRHHEVLAPEVLN